MKIGFPKERHPDETRVALDIASLKKLRGYCPDIVIEAGLGDSIGVADAEYAAAGATVTSDRSHLLKDSDVVVRIRKPEVSEVSELKSGSIHISYLDPFNEGDLVRAFESANITAISMEMIPRTTKAQKMDVLSSQANLAGYVAVIEAASVQGKIFPMMMTPAGTISPTRVFIIGAGVAGLQAIATAKRMGAKVEAFDTRAVVEEQVQSLGAKFVKVDLGETGQTKDGYAKALTEEQLAIQREAMAKHCAMSDVVITTAQLFGRKAPIVITEDIVKRMAPGSVIIDLAVETGGNVEGSELYKVVDKNGVKIVGYGNWPCRVPVHASQMLAANFFNLISEFWNKESNSFNLNLEDEIQKGCVITHGGNLVNQQIAAVYAK